MIDAAAQFGRAMPMMMTAAGTIAPARVLVMGVGVAGLQAIATARRLGAIVSRHRRAPRHQGTGGKSWARTFVAVMDDEFKHAQTAAGYAKDMSKEYQAKQAALIAETIKKQDIVITTALIPGRKAPVLVTEEMVKTMKPGSVIVDLAAEQGGNLPADQGRRSDRGPWRHHHGLHQSARAAGGGFVLALCPQPVQFRLPDRRQEDRRAGARLGRRDHQGRRPDARTARSSIRR